jgi:diamine N-acetyltransferase
MGDVLARFPELERGDLAALNRLPNDLEIIRHLGAKHSISPEADAHWFDTYFAAQEPALPLAISDADVHRVRRFAEFSVFIREPEHWSWRHTTEAARIVLSRAFDDLDLHPLYLTVLGTPAARLCERVGFAHEPPESALKEGRSRDVSAMAILEPEYQGRKGEA